MKSKVLAIVPAAGRGRRMGEGKKKPFIALAGKPLVYYALKALEDSGTVDAVMIASDRSSVKRFERLVKRFKFKKVTGIVVGGKTRYESVRNCVAKADKSFDIILIHDGARPLVEKYLIEDSVRLARRFGAAIAALAESDTVKLSGKGLFIKKTLNRDEVLRAQTPQAFRRSIIDRAYALKHAAKGITDDAGLVERLGKRVKILKGSPRNFKITNKEDLKLAEVLYESRHRIRHTQAGRG